MFKFYLTAGLQERGLGGSDVSRMKEIIKDRVYGVAETELTGSVETSTGENVFYKAASYDSTGLFSMPFRTGTYIKVVLSSEPEDPKSFDRLFIVGLV